MTVEALLDQIRALPLAERRRLAQLILDSLKDDEPVTKKRSLLDFEGFAAEARMDEDPQDYINRLRDEWDAPR